MNILIMEFGINWGWILGIIFVLAILWLIVKALTREKDSNPNLTNNKSPLDVLKDRYARGIIGKAEFEEKKRTIL